MRFKNSIGSKAAGVIDPVGTLGEYVVTPELVKCFDQALDFIRDAVGDLVPVGDLFDVVAHGDEAFSAEMAIHFDNARRLYHQKLLPMLEKQHGRCEELEQLPWDDRRRTAFRNNDRLVKTLLLGALVPGVETLRGVTAERLAALNHGTIRTPIEGREAKKYRGGSSAGPLASARSASARARTRRLPCI